MSFFGIEPAEKYLMVMQFFLLLFLVISGFQSLEAAVVECIETAQRIASLRDSLENASDHSFFMDRGLVTRSLGNNTSFKTLLKPESVSELFELGSDQRWLNVGGGALQAEADMIAKKGDESPQIVSINIHKLDPAYVWPKSIQGFMKEPRKFVRQKLVVLDQTYIEKVDPEDIGKFHAITDVLSSVAYSPHLDFVLYQFGQLAEANAKIYISGFNPNFPNRRLRDAWLEKIRGFKILEDNKDQKGVRLILQRTSEHMYVPTLRILDVQVGKPPVFRFVEYENQDGPIPTMYVGH
ncbi:MAG: hypothetical protein J0L93_00985 [Deltaproteobacteria bacterium]|nr:hypothetical protein [Deltaproteobacteria bacterium]